MRSLKTNDGKAAERAALPLIEHAHNLMDQARNAHTNGPSSELPSHLIASLASAHEADLLVNDEKLRAAGIGLNMKRDGLAPDGLGMSVDDIRLYRSTIELLDGMTRDQVARMRAGDTLQRAVDSALEKEGVILHPDDPAWRQLELAFLKAQRKAFEVIKSRLAGEDVPTPVLLKKPIHIISSALVRWIDAGGRGSRKPREGSIGEAQRAVQRFIELYGDLSLTSITKVHGREFRDALAKIPKALPQALLVKRLPDLLKEDLSGFQPRNVQTINKTLALLSGIFAKAEREGFFETLPGWSNPFHVGFEISHSDREPYQPFGIEELTRLFTSPVFSSGHRPVGGRGEAAFWFPLIALFSGARRTEIAQLTVADVRESAGIWFFDLSDKGADQQLKNVSSARSVPIHHELIRAGFLEFVSVQVQKGPNASLWPSFEPPIAPKAKAWTKWFSRYLSKHVVDDPAKTFHSFRHTFKRACREAGISEEIHNALTGHSGGGVGRSYGRQRRSDGSFDRGVSLEKLKSEIDRVGYPGLVLPHKKLREEAGGREAVS